ncbi:hypothetical protein [Anaeromyxobacter oryzae]|uniref:Lipoprotein n=1 Tax=Anaeromyxobacter oryzae TaxID=2918170 RepID=A0ABN6MYL2_9BACT|nr:hypothetical protein [Anaeromyxobacter oryzae]BDG05335.1 hypothetical protein AMOR_43310 [Anaeromyxobacter oryzae]
MKRVLWVALLASGCAHVAIRKVSDCERFQAEQRVECSACVVQNEAQGWLGTYEYRPDAAAGSRCVRVK